jgi:hypothetical protein
MQDHPLSERMFASTTRTGKPDLPIGHRMDDARR